MSVECNPFISIITVCFNSENEIKETIQSVSEQTYLNFEYIVVDGKSTDQTMCILDDYRNLIDQCVSESDGGIYEAMNKGVNLAKGEWLLFLNAGDSFASSEVLEMSAIKLKNSNADICYGSYYLKKKQQNILISPGLLKDLWKGMIFSHQSAFIRRSLLLEFPFDTRFIIAGDYDFFFKSYLNHKVFQNLEFPVSCYRPDGVSDQRRFLSLKERWQVVFNHLSIVQKVIFVFNVLYIGLRSFMKWFLGPIYSRLCQMRVK